MHMTPVVSFFALGMAVLILRLSCIADRVPGAFSQYDFTYTACQNGSIPDSIGGDVFYGDLIMNKNLTSCRQGIGIVSNGSVAGNEELPGLTSTGTTKHDFKAMIKANGKFLGFTIDMWLRIYSMECSQLERHDTCLAPIMTISDPIFEPDDACDETSSMELLYNIPFQVFVYKLLDYWDGDCYFSYGSHKFLMGGDDPVHVVFAMSPQANRDGYRDWYINGELLDWDWAFDLLPDQMLTHWYDTYHLYMIDRPRYKESTEYIPFLGEIYLLSMYPHYFNSSEVEQNFNSLISQSIPFVYDVSVVMNEDGEVGDHYSQPEFYLENVPSTDLHIIYLDVYDDDNCGVENPNRGHNLSFPTAVIYTHPVNGTLHTLSGQDILHLPHDIMMGNDFSYGLRYRPFKDKYNDNEFFDSFVYGAKDGESNGTSLENATVYIYVLPKNDPPVAYNASANVTLGTNDNVIDLYGDDIDIGDSVPTAAFSRLPARGTLYQVDPSGGITDDVIEAGDLLRSMRAAYEYNVDFLEPNFPKQTYLDTESFTFHVFDSDHNRSLDAFVTIHLTHEVKALTSESRNRDHSWITKEDSDNIVKMYGMNSGELRGDLTIVLDSLPVHGTVYDPARTRRVALGVGNSFKTKVKYPYLDGIGFIYHPDSDYFSSPTKDWNGFNLELEGDNISYHVTTVIGTAVITTTTVFQEIRVVNVNDNFTFTCPTQRYETLAAGNVVNSTLDKVYMYGFTLSDEVDLHVDAVHAVIDAQYGAMTLNEKHLTYIDFTSIKSCYSNDHWRCMGGSVLSTTMSFVAPPDQLLLALNGMQYRTYKTHVMENISITIADGAGGTDCLADSQFRTTSYRPFCRVISCYIEVNVTDKNFDDGFEFVDDWFFNFYVDLPLWICLFATLVWLAIFTIRLIVKHLCRLFCIYMRKLWRCLTIAVPDEAHAKKRKNKWPKKIGLKKKIGIHDKSSNRSSKRVWSVE